MSTCFSELYEVGAYAWIIFMLNGFVIHFKLYNIILDYYKTQYTTVNFFIDDYSYSILVCCYIRLFHSGLRKVNQLHYPSEC